MPDRIERVTVYTLRVPIAVEKVNCRVFAHETLQRGPTGLLDGPWFGSVPTLVMKVEGAGKQGWADLSRTVTTDEATRLAPQLLGLELGEIKPEDAPIKDTKAGRGFHTAPLDWAARVKGVPLYAMFGPRVRDGVQIAWWSGHRSPTGAAELAARAWASGVKCLKLKSSMKTDDAGIARAVAKVAPEIELLIDPNGRWENYEATLPRARGLAEGHAHVLLEDPIYSAHALVGRIGREAGLRVVITAVGVPGVERALLASPVGLNLVGMWPQLLAASDRAQELGLMFWAGSAVDTGLFDMATLHFAVTQRNFTMAAELAGSQVREHSLLTEPMPIVNGVARVSDLPGLGVEVDERALERYGIAPKVVLE